MSCSCSGYQSTVDQQFDTERAVNELKAYRRGRLESTTRLLRDAIVNAGLNRGTLLDVGAGVGALTFELLERGMNRAFAEASAAYADAVHEEAIRRNRVSAIEILRGDVVEMPQTMLPHADVVTLDRVVCCYPFFRPMLARAAHRAGAGLALSYPTNRWYVRVMFSFDNWRRARKTSFRTFVHPPHEMQQVVEAAGFTLAARRRTLVWNVDVFAKQRAQAR
jgi:magnesium-protoporphyrin O-methyltransferase